MRFPNTLFSPIAYHTSFTENQRIYYSENETISPIENLQSLYSQKFLEVKVKRFSGGRLEFVNEERKSEFRDIILKEEIDIR